MEIDHLDHIDFCRQIDSCSLRRDEYDDAVLLVGRGDDLVFDINGNGYGGRRGSQIRRRGGRRQLRHYSGVDFVHADRPRRPPQTRLLGRRHLQRHRYEKQPRKKFNIFPRDDVIHPNRLAHDEELAALESDANRQQRTRDSRRSPRRTDHRRHSAHLHQKVNKFLSFYSLFCNLIFISFGAQELRRQRKQRPPN